jgi:hypothetical protein
MADSAEEAGKGDTRWVSYSDLAEARGIDRDSVIRIVRRRGWPKQESNDGTVRVQVSRAVLEGKQRPRSELRADRPADLGRVIKGLEGQIAAKNAHLMALTEQLGRERLVADEARQRAAKAEAARDQALVDRKADQDAVRKLAADLTRWKTLGGGRDGGTAARDGPPLSRSSHDIEPASSAERSIHSAFAERASRWRSDPVRKALAELAAEMDAEKDHPGAEEQATPLRREADSAPELASWMETIPRFEPSADSSERRARWRWLRRRRVARIGQTTQL